MGRTATLKPNQRRTAARASRDNADGRPLMTVPEAAAYLRLHRATVYVLMNDGHLRYTEVAGKRRIRPGDLDDYIDAHVL